MSTPLMIHIALWYHCRVGDYGKGTGDNNWSAPAVQQELRGFVSNGLLRTTGEEADGIQYEATDRLRAWVDAICSVPFPVQKWVMPENWTKDIAPNRD